MAEPLYYPWAHAVPVSLGGLDQPAAENQVRTHRRADHLHPPLQHRVLAESLTRYLSASSCLSVLPGWCAENDVWLDVVRFLATGCGTGDQIGSPAVDEVFKRLPNVAAAMVVRAFKLAIREARRALGMHSDPDAKPEAVSLNRRRTSRSHPADPPTLLHRGRSQKFGTDTRNGPSL